MAVASSGRPNGARQRLARIARFAIKASATNIPNLLTSFRMAVALPIAWLIFTGDDELAFLLFIAAALSDAADGFIAKRFNSCSTFGAILDPLADKLLVISCLVALASRDLIPVWLVALVFMRDVLLVLGGALLKLRLSNFSVQPLIVGKLWTLGVMLAIGATLAATSGWLSWSMPTPAVHHLLGITLLASALSYLTAALPAWTGRSDETR